MPSRQVVVYPQNKQIIEVTTGEVKQVKVQRTDKQITVFTGSNITAGGGDMGGPASSTDENIAVFDGITGKLVKDGGQTIAELEAKIPAKVTEQLTLTATNISDKYVDLTNTPLDATAVGLFPVGGIKQQYTVDYTVVTDTATIKRLNWNGLGLESLLAENDVISVDYMY